MSDGFTSWQLPSVASGDNPRGVVLRTARQLEELQEQAWNEAFAQGKAEGYADGIKEAKEHGKRIAELLRLLGQPLEELDAAVIEQLASLATTIAAHIVRREVRQDPHQIIAVAREAVRALPMSAREVQVRLHPDDAALLREHAGAETGWKLVEDPAMARGGLTVHAEQSQVDMRIERRIGEIAASILGGERSEDAGSGE